MKSNKKHNLATIEFSIAIILLFSLAAAMLGSPSITGQVSLEIVLDNVDLEMKQSQTYKISTENTQPIEISSFRISGEVIGDGRVEIYLDNGEGQQLLIYKNTKKQVSGLESITGLAVAEETTTNAQISLEQGTIIENAQLSELEEDEKAISGPFSKECTQTCHIRMRVTKQDVYELVFKIEKGTSLKVSSIVYTVETS